MTTTLALLAILTLSVAVAFGVAVAAWLGDLLAELVRSFRHTLATHHA